MARTPHAMRTGMTALLVGALLAPVLASPAVGADDDVVIIPSTVPLITQSTDSSFFFVEGDGSIDITVPTGESIAPQCVPISGGIVTCIGAPSQRDPLEDTGVGGLSDFLASDSGDHVGALAWIIREAIDALALLYDLPNDGRVERYAGDEIRGYVLSRVIDIFDRSLYGVALTPDEQRTYDYFTEIFLESDRAVAQYAQDEYTRFMTNECGYRPPAAPDFVEDPVVLPEAVANWCSRPRTSLENQFVFAPPIPSAAEFQAWGVYRNAEALGLDAYMNGTVQQNLVDAQNAAYQIGAVGAVAGAAIAGGAASAFVAGSSSGIAGAIAGVVAPYAGSAFFVPSGVAGTAGSSIITGSVTASAAAAAATVVAIVVVAIVVTAVAIVQLVQYEEVGRTVSANLANALASRDPFGLDARRSDFAGLDLRENLPIDSLPAYRSANAMARILGTVVDVTSARYGGVYVSDTTGIWADNATTPSDFSFFVSDSAGSRTATSIVIPVEGVDTTVRFSDGWIITNSGAGERATLSFPFITPAGEPALASRTALSDGGFTVSVLQPDNTLKQENVDAIEYLDSHGDLVSVSLVSDSTSGLAGPTPSAVGPLTPGRTVILRPNPVDVNGSFDLDRFVTGYDYSWTVVRHDPSSNAWVEVATANGYDTRFIPESVGAYRATVLMSDTDAADGVDDDVWGAVNFSVTAPAVDIASLQLVDDGIDALRVTLQLTAAVPSNDYTVAVTWPGSVQGDAPTTTTLALPCIEVDSLSCSTVNTASFPEFDDRLAYTLPHDAALAQGVTVTITDRFGGGITQRFAIDDAARPTTIEPRTAPSPAQPGIVTFAPEMSTLQVPVGYGVDPNYEIARLAPGTGGSPTNFGLVDPSTDLPVTSLELPGGGARASIVYDSDLDEWLVSIRVTATAAEVGRQVVPLVVQQVTGARTVLPLTLDLVPASGDRFRGAVASSVDPDNFSVEGLPTMIPYVMGGKAEWGEYDSEVCVSLEYTNFPTDPIELCGPVDDLLDDDGAFTPISFRDFEPTGLRGGRYEVSVSVPTGDRSDSTPIVSSFLLLFGPPSIGEITFDPTTNAVAFSTQEADPDVPIDTVECRLDGEPVDCADATRGVWPGGGLAAGEHTFSVDVVAVGGNFTQRSLTFEATETIDPEPAEPPSITLSTRTVAAGDSLTLSGAGFVAGETVTIELQSDPVTLATVTADDDGAFRESVTIPVDTAPGPHDIVATGVISDDEVRVAITVLPAALTTTGASPIDGLILAALIVLVLGLGLMVVHRAMRVSRVGARTSVA